MANPGSPLPPRVSLDQQVACVIREIAMRERVYPNWIAAKKMSQEKASHETAAMRAVLATVNDYIDMQPKVLAISSVCLTLAEKLGMDKEQLDHLLERAEAAARDELAKAVTP